MKRIVILMVVIISLVGTLSAQASYWNSLSKSEKGWALTFSGIGVDSVISMFDYIETLPTYKDNAQKLSALVEIRQFIFDVQSLLLKKVSDYGVGNTIDLIDKFYKKPENASIRVGSALMKILREF